METHAPKAVFLSYASQDADAARRIANALRGFGVEVWFDQSELRGGDAWDQKIRKQIHECTLFLPIISSTTQERGEGYFRREWHLATDRTLDLAEGVPFIVPVAVDDIPEFSVAVPEQFLRVQWTRLPHGEPTPQFVEQVKHLLTLPRKPVGGHWTGAASPRSTESARSGRRAHRWKSVTAAAVIVGTASAVVIWQKLQPPKPAGEERLKPAASTVTDTSRSATPKADKSIAVLPFKNLSEEKDSAFYADGLHEDVLTNLRAIRGLRVISRLSVEQYRATTKSSRQIGEDLGVAYVFEGSVSRKENSVRVAGQLVDTRTEAIVWDRKYEADRGNVFALQSDLAQGIATTLHIALSTQEKAKLARCPTKDPAAYDLYLQAREITRHASGNRQKAVALLDAAVGLDKEFTDAWALLCYLHSYLYGSDRTEARKAKAKLAMDTATRLAPDSPEVIRVGGDYHLYCLRDYDGATERYNRILRAQPDDTEALKQLSAVEHRQGRWVEMLAHVYRYLELDPGDLFVAETLASEMLVVGRRYSEATAVQRRIVNLQPDSLLAAYTLARIPFRASGSTQEIEELFARWAERDPKSTDAILLRKEWARRTGNIEEWRRLNERSSDGQAAAAWIKFEVGVLLAANGDLAGARELIKNRPAAIQERLKEEPANERLWSELGEIEALLGHPEEALRCARKAVELRPESSDAFVGPYLSRRLAFVYAWTGDKNRAVAEYARLLKIPHGTDGIHAMKRDPRFAPLRGDPRFDALLNDPKNNAPLF